MATINGNKIMMVRGDTAVITLALSVNGTAYTQKDNDTVVFSVKADYDDSAYALQKAIKNNVLTLNHDDTQKLEVGSYVWDIQIKIGDTNQVSTIGPGKLVLTQDVTTI